jgi:hypothetical protein
LLSDYVLANGWDNKIVALANGKLDVAASATALASVSVTVSEYAALLEHLFDIFE